MTDKVELANEIVRSAFRTKKDLNNVPYLHHCLTVAQNAVELNSSRPYSTGATNDECQIVGILHDLLEDCPEWTEGALRDLFDENIVDAIVAITKLPNSESYDEYIARVGENHIARIVKIADLEHNMDITRFRSFSDVDIERLSKYHRAHKRLIKYIKP